MKEKKPRVSYSDGPCPFLLCLEAGPHTHPICPACGAVRYGNLYCDECRKHAKAKEEETLRHLASKGAKIQRLN